MLINEVICRHFSASHLVSTDLSIEISIERTRDKVRCAYLSLCTKWNILCKQLIFLNVFIHSMEKISNLNNKKTINKNNYLTHFTGRYQFFLLLIIYISVLFKMVNAVVNYRQRWYRLVKTGLLNNIRNISNDFNAEVTISVSRNNFVNTFKPSIQWAIPLLNTYQLRVNKTVYGVLGWIYCFKCVLLLSYYTTEVFEVFALCS